VVVAARGAVNGSGPNDNLPPSQLTALFFVIIIHPHTQAQAEGAPAPFSDDGGQKKRGGGGGSNIQ